MAFTANRQQLTLLLGIAILLLIVTSIIFIISFSGILNNEEGKNPITPTPIPTAVPTNAITPKPTTTPQIVQTPASNLKLDTVLELPGVEGFEAGGFAGQEEGSKYSESTWKSAGVTWSYTDTWKLHEIFLTVNEIPSTLYTLDKETVYTVQVPWRIVWTVTSGDVGPYSDVWLSLFKIDKETNQAPLLETFGWQGHHSAEKTKVEGLFGPGTYAIGIFVRNAGVSVDVQYSTMAGTYAYDEELK